MDPSESLAEQVNFLIREGECCEPDTPESVLLDLQDEINQEEGESPNTRYELLAENGFEVPVRTGAFGKSKVVNEWNETGTETFTISVYDNADKIGEVEDGLKLTVHLDFKIDENIHGKFIDWVVDNIEVNLEEAKIRDLI